MQRWPIFVLTLPGDEERRAPLLRRLDGFGLDYELFMGVDGRAGLPDDYRGMVDPDAARDRLGYSMTDGEFACALSHRAIYAKLCDDDLPGAIILEDDAQLADGFADFIRSDCYQKLPMTLIDYAFGRALPLLRHRSAGGQPWVLRRAVQGTVTTAYTLRQDAARRLLDATTPVSHPADWPVELFQVGAWMCVPRLAWHDAPGQRVSHLDKERQSDKVPKRQKRGFWGSIRSRISVRVGRAKGQR